MIFCKAARQINRPIIFKFTLTPVILTPVIPFDDPVTSSGQKLPFIFLILCLVFCREISANNDPAPVFELKNLFMRQPIYTIKIYADGKVHYHSDKHKAVSVISDQYAELTQTQLNELIIYFLSLPFEVSKKYEMKRGNAIWANIIDYKDVYASIHMNDPVFFAVLMKRLDKLINIRQWVCLPKNHPKFNDHCIQDDLPENPDDLKYYLEH